MAFTFCLTCSYVSVTLKCVSTATVAQKLMHAHPGMHNFQRIVVILLSSPALLYHSKRLSFRNVTALLQQESYYEANTTN